VECFGSAADVAFDASPGLEFDNGRVLGFDNAHGVHERHYMGKVTPTVFKDYPATAERFYREVEQLRRSYED
jgi:hypothetical protein